MTSPLLILTLVPALVLLRSALLIAQPNPAPYQIEHGTVTMTMRMLGVTLTVTMHFDAYGRRQLTILRGQAQGKPVSLNVLESGSTYLMWDNTTNRGDRRKLTRNPLGPLSLVTGLDMTVRRAPIPDSVRTIVGKVCTGERCIQGGATGEFWSWKGVLLDSRIHGDNADVTFEATRADFMTPVDEGLFDVPDNIVIIDHRE